MAKKDLAQDKLSSKRKTKSKPNSKFKREKKGRTEMKLTAPTTTEATAQAQPQDSGSSWDSLLGEEFLEDQLDAALKQGDAEDATAGSLIDTGEQAADNATDGDAPNEETDEQGILTDCCVKIFVPIRKRVDIDPVIVVARNQDNGCWLAGWGVSREEHGKIVEFGNPLTPDCEQWATAALAVADAVDQIDSYFALHVDNERLVAAVRQDLAEYKRQVEADGWQLPAVEGGEQLVVDQAQVTCWDAEAEATATCNCQAACPTCNCEQAAEVTITEVTPTDSLPSVDQPRTSADDADALERIRSAQDEVDRLHDEWEELKDEAKDAKKRWEAAVKRQGELIKELTTPLPLFDGGKKQEQGQAKAETAPQLVVEPETKPEESPVLPDEAIGTKRVKLTADLSMEGEQGNDITIGLAGDIKTAYVSQHGELYLTFGLSDRWLLQPEEYDELPEQEHPAADSIPVVDENAWRQTPIGSLDIPKGLVQILEEDNNIRTIGDMSDWVKAHADSPDPLLELKKVGPAKAEAYRKAEAKFWETIGS